MEWVSIFVAVHCSMTWEWERMAQNCVKADSVKEH